MSNAPFKIAFWMMSLAFGLTILMVGLNPEEIRFALNPDKRIPVENEFEILQEEEIATASQNQNVSEVPSPFEKIDDFETIALKPLDASGNRENSPTLVSQPNKTKFDNGLNQVRVASADVNAPLGLSSEVVEEKTILVPIPDQRFAYSDRAHLAPEVSKPVPDPVELPARYQVSLNDEIAELKGHVLRLKLAEARKEFEALRRSQVQSDFEQVQAELDSLKQQIEEFKVSQSPIIAPDDEDEKAEVKKYERTETETEQSSVTDLQLTSGEVAEADSNAVIEVTPTETENLFNFRFEAAPIGEVLETLGKHGGRTIVLSSGIEGRFDGEFKQMTPNRAFAAVIKAKQLGLSFRGDYVLVRAERDPRIR